MTPVRVVSNWLRVGSMAADSFGWVVADGFRWFREVSEGFGWFRVVCCFSSYDYIQYFESFLFTISCKVIEAGCRDFRKCCITFFLLLLLLFLVMFVCFDLQHCIWY